MGPVLVTARVCATVAAHMRACFVRGARLPWPLLLASAFALCSALVASARAEDKRAAALNWVRLPGAETCIDATNLARRVEERLARPVFPAPAQATLIVEGRVEKSATGFAAVLHVFDQAGASLGSRELGSDKADCAELSETVALVLAVMIDPDGALAVTPAAPKEAPPPTPPRPEPAPVELPPVPRDTTLRDLSLFGRLELGSLPKPAFGVGVAALISWSKLRTFRAEGAGFFDQDRTIAGEPGRGAYFRLVYAALVYCPLFMSRSHLTITGCAGAAGGVLQSRGHGLDPRERDQVDPVLSGIAQLRGDVKIYGVLRALAGAGVGLPFVRTLFEVTDREGVTRELFEQGSLTASFDLGLAARF